MKCSIFAFIAIVLLTGCSRGCASFDKRFQTSDRKYEISVYSGGKIVFNDTVETIINSEEKSDGIYYYKKDTLVEISGDYILKSVK